MHVLLLFDDFCFITFLELKGSWIYSHFTSTLPCISGDSSIQICDTFPMPFVELKHKNTSKKQRSGSTTPRSKRCQWTSPTSFERWIRRKGANGALTSLDNSGWTRTKENKKSLSTGCDNQHQSRIGIPGCFRKEWYPKSSILIGVSIINHPILGGPTPLFWGPPTWETRKLPPLPPLMMEAAAKR